MSEAGMMLMSASGVRGSPGSRRRPLTNTSVRVAPSPRRSTEAVPVEKFDRLPPWPPNAWGSELTRSSTRVVPCNRASTAPITVIGLTPDSCGWNTRSGDDDLARVVCLNRGGGTSAGGGGCLLRMGRGGDADRQRGERGCDAESRPADHVAIPPYMARASTASRRAALFVDCQK